MTGRVDSEPGEAPEEEKPLQSGDLFEKLDPFKRLPKGAAPVGFIAFRKLGWCISAVYSMEKWKDKLMHLQASGERLLQKEAL